jgi:hypothetical protein
MDASTLRDSLQATKDFLRRYADAVHPPKLKQPRIGDVEDGHRYKGGNPSLKSSWEVVGEQK